MKKVLFIIVAILCITTTVYGQDEVSLGVKAGVNFSKIQGDDVEDLDGRTGFHLGAIVEIPITEKFSVQPEVMYSQQGLQNDENDFETKIKLDYIIVPVLAKYFIANGISVEAGPQFGFIAKAEQTLDGQIGDIIFDQEDDISDEVAGFDLGAAIGAGFETTSGLFFQARYIIGLSNVDDSDEGGLFEDDLTNSNLQFSVGLKF